MDANPNPPRTPTPALAIALAWLVVAIPLGWGVYETVMKSLPLFQAPTQPGERK